MSTIIRVATLKSRIKRISCIQNLVYIGKKLHCQLEPGNHHSKNVIVVRPEEGDVVGHIPDILAHALVPEIRCGSIASVEAR